MPLDFDPASERVRRDLYGAYDVLRTESPVHRSSQGLWFLSRFRDVERALRDKRLHRGALVGFLTALFGPGPIVELQKRTLLFLDPPDHGRVRSLVTVAFSARRIAALEGAIQALVDRLLDRAAEKPSFDLIADFALPLPATVISDMLGVPSADQERLRVWVEAIGATLDLRLDEESLRAATEAAVRLTEFVRELVAERRREPRDDLVSALVQAEEQGGRLTEAELVSTCGVLFVGGHETSANLIGNGIHALLTHPRELEKLRSEPALIGPAVEEILRYESPVQLTSRVATEDLDIGGETIRAGEMVVTLIGAANRDPEAFADPGRFDVRRTGEPPVAFGGGIHHCIGAALGRLEGRIAIASVVRRFPSLEIEDARWKDTVTLRGLRRLAVRVRS